MIRQGLAAIRLLDLPQRPPTPPKGSDHADVRTGPGWPSFPDIFGENTPLGNSPSSSAESPYTSSAKPSKKVAWSSTNEYNDPPKTATPPGSLRRIPSSADLKPTKSILKAHNANDTPQRTGSVTKSAAPHTYPNFAVMLESIVQQLAGADRNSRVDAYLTLSGVLKAMENVPDLQALKDKMPLLSQFTQRDMLAKTSSGTMDTGLINNALGLLATLVWKTTLSDLVPTDLCAYLVEHTITALRDVQVSKDILRHLLYILGQQSFPPKIMTPERVRRLIEALGDPENQVKARSLLLCRITVYRKLLKQAKGSMLSTLCWLDNVFADMISNFKEVRGPAVGLGAEAALLLGTEKQASRAVMELFSRTDEEKSYGEHYKNTLITMVRQREYGHLVPQIWSVVVLYMRSRPRQFEQWNLMNSWMQIIEKCFNTADKETKLQAFLAWNRLVFAVHLDEKTSVPMVHFLNKALEVPLLKRKASTESAKAVKQANIGSICNLLYYALRPDASHAQLDIYWEEYVVKLVGKTLISPGEDGRDADSDSFSQAFEILSALLDTTPKAWENNRATTPGLVKASELPGLDPRWARKNAAQVFKVMGPFIEQCFLDPGERGSLAMQLWSKFVASVAAAGAKEIKVSNDTMSAMAAMFGLLFKLWETHTVPSGVPSHAQREMMTPFQKLFSDMVSHITTTLGFLPFTEKLLALGPQESFAIVSTPSHGPFKAKGDVKSPLHHLFLLLLHPPPGINCDVYYKYFLITVLAPFLSQRKTRGSQLDFLLDLFHLLPDQFTAKEPAVHLWEIVASYCTDALKMKAAGVPGIGSGLASNSQGSTTEYRNILIILEYGIACERVISKVWEDLFLTLSNVVTRETGESGCAIAVIEPLSRYLHELPPWLQPRNRPYFEVLFAKATYPRDKQSFEAARRLVLGTPKSTSKSQSFEPYSHLYHLVVQWLKETYLTIEPDQVIRTGIPKTLRNLVQMISRCPLQLVTNVLTSTQDGVILWLRDEADRVGHARGGLILPIIADLWSQICARTAELPRRDNDLLKSLEPLVTAALSSRHKAVVARAVLLWNLTFGAQDALEYSPNLASALRRLRVVADLQLPTFPEVDGDEAVAEAPVFPDNSQEDLLPQMLDTSRRTRTSKGTQRNLRLPSAPVTRLSRSASPRVIIESPQSSLPRKRPFEGTPEAQRRKLARRDVTPKLRHDDSQVQFTTIESSPLGEAVQDSQLLTDRQKEIRDRQQESGLLFVDAPAVKSSGQLSKLNLTSSTADANTPDIPTTPTLTTRERVPRDTYFENSPTPRRGYVHLQLDSDAPDIPSSPIAPVERRPVGDGAVVLNADHEFDEDTHMQDEIPGISTPVNSKNVSVNSSDLGPWAQPMGVAPVYISSGDTSTATNAFTQQPAQDDIARLSSPSNDSDNIQELPTTRRAKQVFVDAPTSPQLASSSPMRYEETQESFLPESVEKPALEVQATRQAVTVTPDRQDTSFSFNEDDERSVLRLATKYDRSVDTRGQDAAPATERPTLDEEQLIQTSPLSQTEDTEDVEREKEQSEYTEERPRRSKRISPTKAQKDDKSILSSPAMSPAIQARVLVAFDAPATTAPEVATEQQEPHMLEDDEDMDSLLSSPLSSVADMEVDEIDEEISLDNDEIEHTSDHIKDLTGLADHTENHESTTLHMGEAEVVDETPGEKPQTPSHFTIAMPRPETTIEAAPHPASPPPPTPSPLTGQTIITNFEQMIASLSTVTLTRSEAQKLENLIWDMKGELYAAEKRGRMA